MTLSELKELIELVAEKGFAEFEVERSGFRLKIVAHHPPVAATLSSASAAPQLAATSPEPVAMPSTPASAPAPAPAPMPAPAVAEEKLHTVTSPIVGTFYRAAGPASEPFIKIGDQVEPGTVLCIIEAMKLMNEIEAEVSGEVVKILVENGQPVEYGQPLFGIKA